MTCARLQKVDLFSLGIILFEMSYWPMTTGSERITVLGQLREVSRRSGLGERISHDQFRPAVASSHVFPPPQEPSIFPDDFSTNEQVAQVRASTLRAFAVHLLRAHRFSSLPVREK